MSRTKFGDFLKRKIKKPTRNLEETIIYINNKKKWNLKECREELDNLFQYQLKDYKLNRHINDDKINFYIKYVKHQAETLKGFESHLLTLIATIFLPLSFLVGFFGMNFKSMGAPSRNIGIFTLPNAQLHVLSISFILVVLIAWFFYFYLKLL